MERTPGRLTWNLRIHPWKRKIIFHSIIFRFYVNLRGCKFWPNKGDAPVLNHHLGAQVVFSVAIIWPGKFLVVKVIQGCDVWRFKQNELLNILSNENSNRPLEHTPEYNRDASMEGFLSKTGVEGILQGYIGVFIDHFTGKIQRRQWVLCNLIGNVEPQTPIS